MDIVICMLRVTAVVLALPPVALLLLSVYLERRLYE